MSAAALAAPLLPTIIQGGMGIGVSNWRLARAVALTGQLGVISGTCADTLMIRRLQDGDLGGHVRRAIAKFPVPAIGAEVIKKYFRPEGRNGEPYKLLPMYQRVTSAAREAVTALGAFVEVTLAKEGHRGMVGINLLTKIQLPNMASILGAMLARVDYILMGAGIPREIPSVISRFVNLETAEMKLDFSPRAETLTLNPREVLQGYEPNLQAPMFLPIVSSVTLADMLLRKAGQIDGFVVETPRAGGHNAPPRGAGRAKPGEIVQYGPRDEVELSEMKALGKPFWMAGSYDSPEKLSEALAGGANGIQVGTLFSISDESGVTSELKRDVIARSQNGTVEVTTDFVASPTGFPFKVAELGYTLSAKEVYEARPRKCDLGYLRTAYEKENGSIGFRCPAEPTEDYLKKGGALVETEGKKCLCNALFATVGHGQLQGEYTEQPLLTSGDALMRLKEFLPVDADHYSAEQVVDYLMRDVRAAQRDASGA